MFSRGYVVYQSQLFLSLCHDAMLLCMCYVINAICTYTMMMEPPHDIIGRTL